MSHSSFESRKISKLRKMLSLTQAEFADIFDTTRETISRWETESVTPPARQRFALQVLERLVHRMMASERSERRE